MSEMQGKRVLAGLLGAAWLAVARPGLADEAAEVMTLPAQEPLITFPEVTEPPLLRALNGPRTLRVQYGRVLDPSDFKATLNGQDVSERFTPEPSRGETVKLPFRSGENTLRIDAVSFLEPEADQVETSDSLRLETYSLRVVYQALPAQVRVRAETGDITEEGVRELLDRHRRGEPPPLLFPAGKR